MHIYSQSLEVLYLLVCFFYIHFIVYVIYFWFLNLLISHTPIMYLMNSPWTCTRTGRVGMKELIGCLFRWWQTSVCHIRVLGAGTICWLANGWVYGRPTTFKIFFGRFNSVHYFSINIFCVWYIINLYPSLKQYCGLNNFILCFTSIPW